MRYIHKSRNSQAHTLLNKACRNLRKSGVKVIYDNFNDKKKLNNFLRAEQKNICCYCQRRIDHFQGDNESGSHNEHFEPEGGPNARIDLQLSYENIYACCNKSKGLKKNLQHCGEYKGSEVIQRNFLQMRKCSDYFKYNVNGEILPQCPMNNFNDVCNNRGALTSIQSEALQMIEVLNLNVDSLKEFRRKVVDDILNSTLDKSKQQLNYTIQKLNTEQKEYVQLVDMVIYFLKKIRSNKQ